MYILNTKKIINELNLAIISDLHFGSKTSSKYLKNVIEKISKMDINYIILPGDIIDNGVFDKNKKDELLDFLKELRTFSKVIMSLGNHDIEHFKDNNWVKNNNYTIFNEINKISNIKVLNDESYYDEKNNINFIGYTEPYENYKHTTDFTSFKEDINSKFSSDFKENTYNILLAHNPMKIDSLAKEYVHILENTDLIISGHMHAGLIHPLMRPLFKKGIGMISPDKKLFPKKTVGHYKLGDIDHIIAQPYTYLPENTKKLRYFNILYPKKIDQIKIKSR